MPLHDVIAEVAFGICPKAFDSALLFTLRLLPDCNIFDTSLVSHKTAGVLPRARLAFFLLFAETAAAVKFVLFTFDETKLFFILIMQNFFINAYFLFSFYKLKQLA